ncbi:MAG TPA: DUF1761 domain-containing protein [Candidatus Saccharimonadales bacterium]|nr:DUF1761 domain-containing protein [Candidatus Saccharimonadales bacterium]
MLTTLTQVHLNYWAILVGGVITMALGMIWYGPATFGKLWMQWNGLTDADMTASKDNVGMLYFIQFIASLVMIYVLAHFVKFFGVTDLSGAWMLGFWIWLGFLVAGSAGIYIFPPKRWELFLFDASYKLVSIVLVAWLLAVWH